MLEAENIPQQFKTQLPYIPPVDTTKGNDSAYVEYLYDSLNVKLPDSTFIFQLTEIILPNDSIADSTQTIVVQKPSFFVPYKVKPVVISPRVRHEVSYDWLTGFFLLSLIILAWVRFEGEKRISQLFRAVFARHNMNQLLRDGDIVNERITPSLMFVYLISFTTLVFTLIRPFNVNIPGATNPFLEYSFLAGGILILWLTKLMTIRVSGKIFRTRFESEEYLITNLIYNIAAGLVAFPFVFAGFYAGNELSLYIGTGIFVIGAVLRFVRSIFVGLSAQTFPVIYLFLYLCTLEILPLLVLYKLLEL